MTSPATTPPATTTPATAPGIDADGTLRITATIHNVVTTAAFDGEIDLPEIAWRHAGELDPASFAAVKLRLQEPRSTGLIFATGRMVVTGCASEQASKLAVDAYYRIVLDVHPDARLKDVAIQNMVFSGTLNAPVDLPKLASAHSTDTIYTPRNFPGLFFDASAVASEKDDLEKAKIIVFLSGKFVVTGVRKRETAARALRASVEYMRPFFSAAALEHRRVMDRVEDEDRLDIDGFDNINVE